MNCAFTQIHFVITGRPYCSPLTELILTEGRREMGLIIRMSTIWGDGGLSIPQNTPPKIPLSHKRFKGKEESNLLITETGGQTRPCPPLRSGCWLLWSSPRHYLVHTAWSHSLLMRLPKGKLRKRSGHLLIVYSSLIYKSGKVLCD